MTERKSAPDLDQIISHLGEMTEDNGLSRTAGRIFGLLLISGTPLAFSELARKLGVSRAGISTNTRLLEEMGLIERISRRADRQDYFEVPSNVWAIQIERQLKRDRRALSHVEALRDAAEQLPDVARSRLTTLEAVLRRSNDICLETIAMIERGDL